MQNNYISKLRTELKSILLAIPSRFIISNWYICVLVLLFHTERKCGWIICVCVLAGGGGGGGGKGYVGPLQNYWEGLDPLPPPTPPPHVLTPTLYINKQQLHIFLFFTNQSIIKSWRVDKVVRTYQYLIRFPSVPYG